MKNRSKIIATLLTVGLLIPTTVCAETGVKFTKDNINFVDNLGNEHSITQNERVFAMGDTVGDNQKILYKTYEGWVHKDYLKKYVTKEMYSTVKLNLRKEPNTECEVLEVVNVNTPLNIVECHIGNKEWYKGVKDDGTEYYVYGEYVNTEQIVIEKNTDDLYWLSRVLMSEMGCNWIPDDVQRMVASVVINRVNSPIYPNTIKDVIFQSGQYANSGSLSSITPTQKVINNARYVLEHGSTIPSNVLGQAGFPQGKGTYATYYDSVLGTTTYFSYF